MPITTIFTQLGIALGLGLLVGLQREHAESRLAGIRTFPLVTVSGTVAALLADAFGAIVLAAAILALVALVIMGNLIESQQRTASPGLTTEMALLLMFGVGAYLVRGHPGVAIAVGGGVAVLLQFKGQLHVLAGRLSDTDFTAIMQFALIALVALPVLPDRAYGPLSVLNPHNIWLMVVLVVGINLAGYIIFRFWGERTGALASGILGGLISSTATAVSYARQTSKAPDRARSATLVIMISTTVMYLRIVFLIGVLAPSVLVDCVPPLAVMLAVFVLLSAAVWRGERPAHEGALAPQNPSELKPALAFGAMYALVLFAVAAVRQRYGSSGLYVVAGISGLDGVDALTLSTAGLMSASELAANTGWRLIVVASLANLVFKAIAVGAAGHRRLLIRVLVLFGIALVAGAALVGLWPDV